MKNLLFIFLLTLLQASLAYAETPLAGVWKLKHLSGEDPVFTEAGKAKMDAYNYMTDDPALKCTPASFTRIVSTPQTYMEIRVLDDMVMIDYEFMDVKRKVSLDPQLTTENAPHSVTTHPHLGRSIARFDKEALVINTTGYDAGVITTLNHRAGLPHCAEMWTEERHTVKGNELSILLTHVDPVYYQQPLVLLAQYESSDESLLEFGCSLEDSDHYNVE
jgi:hypothetical protein